MFYQIPSAIVFHRQLSSTSWSKSWSLRSNLVVISNQSRDLLNPVAAPNRLPIWKEKTRSHHYDQSVLEDQLTPIEPTIHINQGIPLENSVSLLLDVGNIPKILINQSIINQSFLKVALTFITIAVFLCAIMWYVVPYK